MRRGSIKAAAGAEVHLPERAQGQHQFFLLEYKLQALKSGIRDNKISRIGLQWYFPTRLQNNLFRGLNKK